MTEKRLYGMANSNFLNNRETQQRKTVKMPKETSKQLLIGLLRTPVRANKNWRTLTHSNSFNLRPNISNSLKKFRIVLKPKLLSSKHETRNLSVRRNFSQIRVSFKTSPNCLNKEILKRDLKKLLRLKLAYKRNLSTSRLIEMLVSPNSKNSLIKSVKITNKSSEN